MSFGNKLTLGSLALGASLLALGCGEPPDAETTPAIEGEADGGSVVAGEFVRAHRDAAPLLETVEAAFYDVASLVAFLLLVAESDRPARLLAAVRDLVVPLGDGRRDPPVAEPGAVRP